MTELKLTITTPVSGNFNFLKSIDIFINATGLTETRLAWKDLVPSNGVNILNLDLATIDLKEFIKQDTISLRVYTVTDEFLTSDYNINVHSVFYVDAKILGQ